MAQTQPDLIPRGLPVHIVPSAAPEGQDLPRSLAAKARGETRLALIWCGTELLTERGFLSTGIEEILSRVGVPKGSFYHYFKSKQDFGVAVIENYVAFYDEKMTLIFDDASRSPLRRIQRFVDEGKSGMIRYAFRRGCLIGNMGQELAGLNDDFRQRLEAVLLAWEARLKVCLDLAVSAGEMPRTADTAALANFFWIGWEGAILRAKLTQSTAPLDHFAGMFFSLVQSASSTS